MASRDGREGIHRAIASLQRLTEAFRGRRRQLADQAGLTESQWRLLEEIEGERFMPSMFARRRDCTPAAVSRALRPLLERGWVRATISESDARQRVYRLGAEGRQRLRRLRASRERAIAATWAHFAPERIDAFAAFADDLAEALEAYARREGARAKRRRRTDTRRRD